MKITLTIEDATTADMQKLFGGLPPEMGIGLPKDAGETLADALKRNEQELAEAEGTQEQTEALKEQAENLSKEAEPEKAPEEKAPAANSVEAVIAETDATRKRTKTVSLADGPVPNGTEVTDPDGQVGLIAATYRGYAVIEYEDGTGAAFAASDLTAVPQEDTKPAEEPEIEDAVVVEETPPGELTAADLRQVASELVTMKGSAAVMGIFERVAGVKSVSGVAPEKIADVYAAIKKEIAA